MDPGTALGVVQLSASVLKLVAGICSEFTGRGDNISQKLRDLNQRLQTFNLLLNQTVHTSKAQEFPGLDAIRQTLQDCKDFLKQHETALSARGRFEAAPQRLWLSMGPDSTRIDEFCTKFILHCKQLLKQHALYYRIL